MRTIRSVDGVGLILQTKSLQLYMISLLCGIVICFLLCGTCLHVCSHLLSAAFVGSSVVLYYQYFSVLLVRQAMLSASLDGPYQVLDFNVQRPR
jgi:Fe2+ transport system protein B